MKTIPPLKFIILTGAIVLGLGTTARAGGLDADEQAAPITRNTGLLGEAYGTLTYSYINLDGVSTHADDYTFALSRPLSFGLDGILSFDHASSGVFAGSRLKANTLAAALRAFSTSFNWGKPYVEAGGGYAWTRYAGSSDNSFVWNVAVGAEFQLAPALTVTPYIQYVDAPDLSARNTWNFGARANYWIDSRWAVTAGIERNDDQNTAFTVGTNFRF